MFTVMTVILTVLFIFVWLANSSDSKDTKYVNHEIKRVYKRQISIKECRAICSRQKKPECLTPQIHDGACVLFGRQSLRERDIKASCSGTRTGTTDGYRMTTYAPVCPEGFSHLMRRGKHEDIWSDHSCYKFIKASVSWKRAAEMCKNYGSGLVSIETQAEQAHIERMLRELKISGNTWTSGYDRNLDGIWRWTSSASDVVFDSWAPNQPDRNFGDDKCLHLWAYYGYKWDDGSCHWKLNLLCERDAVFSQDGRQ